MQFFSFTRNKGKIILIICLLALIVLISAVIIFLNNYNRVSSNNVAIDFGLKGYSQLKTDVNDLASSDQTVAQNPQYNKFIEQLTTVENVNDSAKNKYYSLTLAYGDLVNAYTETNNHALYNLPQELSNFSKENFPKLYKQADFPQIYCADTTCADTAQPPEMAKVVAEINASGIPDVVKATFAKDLTDVGYISKNDPNRRMFAYVVVAGILNGSGALKQAGLNTKLSLEILDYVQKTYPDEYKKYNQSQK
jgi:hypothetical protein